MASLTEQPQPPYDLPSLLKTPIDQAIPTQALEEILSKPPFLPIPHALNLRTIPLPSSSQIPFYRSGPIHYLTDSDLSLLSSKYNITHVYDLRSRRERDKVPSAIVEGIETIWTPYTVDAGLENAKTEMVPVEKFLEGEGEEKGREAWLSIYKDSMMTYRFVYKVVFKAVRDWKAGEKLGILFHCTAGKDRTGILSALLLALASSSPATISHDYALTRIGTEPYREPLLAHLLSYLKITREDAMKMPGMLEMAATHAWVVVRLLEWMNVEYDDVSEKDIIPANVDDSEKRRWPGVEGWLVKVLEFSIEDVDVMRRNLGVEE